MSRLSQTGCALFLLLGVPVLGHAQVLGNVGVLITEIGVLPTANGPVRYVEMANISLFQRRDVSGATLTILGPTGTMNAFTLPTTPVLTAAAPTVSPSVFTHATVIVSEPPGLPAASLPPGLVVQYVVSTPFQDPSALLPGISSEVCLSFPGPTFPGTDRVVLNGFVGAAVGACPSPWKAGLGFVQNPGGIVNRCLYVDSDSALDWEWTTLTPTPGRLDPAIIQHIDGFFLGGNSTGAGLAGVPPIVGPVSNTSPTIIGNLNVTQAPVIGVKLRFPHPVTNLMRITNPQFDAVISSATNPATGRVTATGSFLASDPFLGNLAFTSPTTWDLVAFPNSFGPGILSIPMGSTPGPPHGTFSVGAAPNSLLPGHPRIERILTDNQTDSTAQASGNVSKVQLDVLPGSTGGGDIWCEVIIYDENGFSYQAKVKNWPSNPLNCNVPNLGLGSNALGNLDLIALCFPPQAELFMVPSLNTANPTGSGGFMGVNLDPLSLFSLMSPLGTNPFHVNTTVDGLYFFSVTDPALSGMSVDVVASEYVPGTGSGTGFVTPNPPVAHVVIQ